MRKIMTSMGLGVALALGAAGAAMAQAPRPNTNRPDSGQRQPGERGDRTDRGMRRGRGGEMALLKGITLTDAQKTRLQTLRSEQKPQMEKTREQFRATMKEARDARQRGDTATARVKMEQVRTQMETERAQHIAALRGILTAEQQKQFDANVAAWKDRESPHGMRGERGMREGRRDARQRPGRNGGGR